MLTKIKHQRLVYQHQVTQTKQSISENRCFSDNFSLKSYSVRSCSTINSITFLMIAIFLIESIDSLRITLLDIPSPLVVGESTELTCNYDLEDNVLYSFKWYKDGIEFYRYVPRDYPPIQFLKMSGINVDVHKSTKKSVFLQNVNLSTRGKYRCEISAEAPTFVTAAKEGNLEINVLPSSGPTITTNQNEYAIGDEIVANCTSDRSNLEIILNFTINGQPITNSIDYEVIYSTQVRSDSLKTSGISLSFLLTEKHLKRGKLKLKCIATVSMYNIQNEAIKILKDRNFQYESMKFYSSESQAARSNVNELENPYLTEMNTIKCFYVLFTTIIHWQFQNFFQ
ncbi:hypothetical protein SSS_05190 [Sarcoptes scabiei]|uniref:Ig-like domain-containing protein n=1 Tax=Sarcoptes scabiei TaxID=52283 RepID=A0A834RH08_SARSC|nr:hypothetical protein SSS_05190 [Sarcoptes scabiei]